MKNRLPLGVMLLLSSAAFADNLRVEMKAEKKRFDTSREKSETTFTSNEKWGYVIKLRNTTFKDLPDVSVEYQIFSKDEKMAAGKGDVDHRRLKGTQKIGDWKANAVSNFETEQVDLTRSQLVGGYYYANRASVKATDSITGIWVRIFSAGKQIAEIIDPPSLATKSKWDAPALPANDK